MLSPGMEYSGIEGFKDLSRRKPENTVSQSSVPIQGKTLRLCPMHDAEIFYENGFKTGRCRMEGSANKKLLYASKVNGIEIVNSVLKRTAGH